MIEKVVSVYIVCGVDFLYVVFDVEMYWYMKR